jgi:PQQ-dependent dehydrogenase (methanol/ethanol family)
MRFRALVAVPLAMALAVMAACSPRASGDGSGDWASYGLTSAETRQSPLTQITPQNVASLKPAWVADLTSIANRAFEATPLVVDGVMYVSTGWSHAIAYDAKSGRELWHYDPKVDKAMGGKGCCGPASRGLAYADGRIFLAAFDGRLIALDTKTGTPVWTAQTLDPASDNTVTGAPRAFGGLVLIGNGGAELGARGSVSAYDQKSGKLAWRFYTVPPKPGTRDGAASDAILAKIAGGWSGEWWKLGGGGTVWDSMAYDPDLDLVYIGVGNGGPWSRQLRSEGKGDNLFLSSIVALKARTGEYVWHFQTTPGDEWDYTATQSIILADMTIDGKPRKVLMQAPKNGFFYILDRATGEYLSGTAYVNVSWAKGLDAKGRPIENPSIRWSENGQTSNQNPGALGGHNWHPMSFSTKTGLVYIPGIEAGFGYAPAGKDYAFHPGTPNMGIDPIATSLPDDLAAIQSAKAGLHGELIAWDPLKQKTAWRVRYPVAWNGGTLVTDGGLVFQGTAQGDLVAYDAGSGKKLWSLNLGAGIVAPPMTYQIDGEQYVAIAVGWGGGLPQVVGGLTSDAAMTGINRLVVLKLNGTGTLPPVPKSTRGPLAPPPSTASAAIIDAGRNIYARRCYFCHGSAVVSGGEVPDLRYSATIGDAEAFRAVVVRGALAKNGMPDFGKVLSAAEADAIRAYAILRANQDKQKAP